MGFTTYIVNPIKKIFYPPLERDKNHNYIQKNKKQNQRDIL